MAGYLSGNNQECSCLQMIVLIVLLVMVPLYYWYMLQPFYIRLGKESRRVAELLSQLPKSIDVQGKTQRQMFCMMAWLQAEYDHLSDSY